MFKGVVSLCESLWWGTDFEIVSICFNDITWNPLYVTPVTVVVVLKMKCRNWVTTGTWDSHVTLTWHHYVWHSWHSWQGSMPVFWCLALNLAGHSPRKPAADSRDTGIIRYHSVTCKYETNMKQIWNKYLQIIPFRNLRLINLCQDANLIQFDNSLVW